MNGSTLTKISLVSPFDVPFDSLNEMEQLALANSILLQRRMKKSRKSKRNFKSENENKENNEQIIEIDCETKKKEVHYLEENIAVDNTDYSNKVLPLEVKDLPIATIKTAIHVLPSTPTNSTK